MNGILITVGIIVMALVFAFIINKLFVYYAKVKGERDNSTLHLRDSQDSKQKEAKEDE